MRKKEDAIKAVEQCVSQFGELNVLINGAAGNFLAPSEDLSVNAFRTGWSIRAGPYNVKSIL